VVIAKSEQGRNWIRDKGRLRNARRKMRYMTVELPLLGERFLRGIVLYTGDQPVPFGSNLHALPVSALWKTGEAPHGITKA